MSVFVGPILKSISDECAVCLLPLRTVPETIPQGETAEQYKNTYYSLECDHEFHEACARRWARAKPGPVTCPICRAPFAAADVAILRGTAVPPHPPGGSAPAPPVEGPSAGGVGGGSPPYQVPPPPSRAAYERHLRMSWELQNGLPPPHLIQSPGVPMVTAQRMLTERSQRYVLPWNVQYNLGLYEAIVHTIFLPRNQTFSFIGPRPIDGMVYNVSVNVTLPNRTVSTIFMATHVVDTVDTQVNLDGFQQLFNNNPLLTFFLSPDDVSDEYFRAGMELWNLFKRAHTWSE